MFIEEILQAMCNIRTLSKEMHETIVSKAWILSAKGLHILDKAARGFERMGLLGRNASTSVDHNNLTEIIAIYLVQSAISIDAAKQQAIGAETLSNPSYQLKKI